MLMSVDVSVYNTPPHFNAIKNTTADGNNR